MKAFKLILILVLFFGLGYGVWFGVQASNCPDTDEDGLDDCEELNLYFTEVYNPDTDGDGYSDGEEVENGFSPHYGDGLRLDEVDSDRDGLMDSEEIERGTNLNSQDSDGDGVSDFLEVQNGSDPINGLMTKSRLDTLKDKILKSDR